MGTVLPGVVPVKVGVKVAGRYSTSVRIVVSRCGVVVQWIAVRNSSVMRTDVSSIRPIITTNIDTLSFAFRWIKRKEQTSKHQNRKPKTVSVDVSKA